MSHEPLTARIRRVVRDPGSVLLGRLNRLYHRSAGGDARPAFHDIDATCPSLRLLDENYAVIREEMEVVLAAREQVPRYHDLAASETYISGAVDPQKNWRVFMLRSPAGTPAANQAKRPRCLTRSTGS